MKRMAVVLLVLAGTQILAAGTGHSAASTYPQAVGKNGETQPPHIGEALKAAGDALDRHQQIAAGIHCEDGLLESYRESCKVVLDLIADHVKQAEEKIAKYDASVRPRGAVYDTSPLRSFRGSQSIFRRRHGRLTRTR